MAAASAAALQAGDPAAFWPEPDWLQAVNDNEGYDWARKAWARARAVPGAWFDADKAEAVVRRWPEWFRLTEDRFAGKPFHLAEWQAITVRLTVGWKIPEEIAEGGEQRIVYIRLFRRLMIWIPRKNGKSEFLAALALLFWAYDAVARGQGFVFARTEAQAAIIFNKMKAMIGYSAELADETTSFAKSIFLKRFFSPFILLPGTAEGTHGKSPTVAVGDEMHEWRSTVIADNLREGMGVRLQPIELYASTAGLKSNPVGKALYDESVGILEGRIEDPATLVVLFAANDDDDPFDEATWFRANPALGVSLRLSYMRGAAAKARGNPRAEATFRCYQLNQWVDGVARWLPVKTWDACAATRDGWRKYPVTLKGRTAFAAFDVSATRDVTTLVLLFPPEGDDDRYRLLCRFWVPEETLAERVKTDAVPYDQWAKLHDETGRPLLETTPGDFVDQNYVAQAIREAKRDYNVQACGYDPWNAAKLVADLQAENEIGEGFFVEMRQGIPTLGEPSKHFERLVFGAQLDHGGNPMLRWMAQNTTVRFDENQNYAPSKKRSAEKIDGIAAAVMATGLCFAANESKDLSYLETDDVLMV